MIGKLIVSAPTREEAIKRMRRSLSEFIVEGVKTTIPYHLQLMDDENFQKGTFNTKYLEEFQFNPEK
jgi:acetyl-CoA carboxylase biotin carboxylase subunit